MKGLIEIDGRTGEGGGQVVRVAVALAALTGQPLKITNVRGNRKGGGLKFQHVTAIQFLADVTEAEVEGLRVGSSTLTFIPKRLPTALVSRNFKITAPSGAASALLILQAVLPFLVFAGNSSDEPIWLEISGGTNVSFSLSYEYLDQVLLPTLEERFGIRVDRKLEMRAWSLGPQSRGKLSLKIYPVPLGQKLRFLQPENSPDPGLDTVKSVDISIIVPEKFHTTLQNELVRGIGDLYPDAECKFKVVEESGSDTRWYILLVAKSASGVRWGRDSLCSMPKKTKSPDLFIRKLANSVCKELYKEVSVGGQVDEHLQDQLICFQALADGYSTFSRDDGAVNEGREGNGEVRQAEVLADAMGNLTLSDGRLRRERTHEPFGHGSLHTKTARFVVCELLPTVEFYNKGDIAKGVGLSFP
ncbi:unnamed protein product [Clonostachys byssicola]|uniref:RNA 3'-terminal phosphate cyclase domain-containing protein n=1 Tax=Clonostachys byssicola TaxID=160290 RepID=A0A9N9USR1_9HYPO|nr:unnamed protein product [Clonostachys byssicola]